jgi:2-keto-4-pentenoate hydratase/2-oxohepta-3-ene-1,7-dioic acid hydratase in catechol pathway
VVTADELDIRALEAVVRIDGDVSQGMAAAPFDWEAARRLSADGTTLYPGDLVVSPALGVVEGIEPGTEVEVEVTGLGTLRQSVLPEFES